MDAYEATRIVFSRIQSLDPENAAKIMGLLLIQDHGEQDMIRLAFGSETLLHSVVFKVRKDLGLLPSSSPATPSGGSAAAGVFSRQNSARFLPVSPPEELIDELQLQDQLSFLGEGSNAQMRAKSGEVFYPDISGDCRSPGASVEGLLHSNSIGWGLNGTSHRRSCGSIADFSPGSDLSGGFGWRPCLYFARGFCKNGNACRFLHDDAAVEQELLLRSKSSKLMASAAPFPYSPTASFPVSPSSASTKYANFLFQHQNDGQRAAPAALMLTGGDEVHKFMGRSRPDFAGISNPGSRQIYLTFPADSTFREEDVSNYFSMYGPVQDVRIPYQQKRMFGFVTFVHPETVKLILAKGNPHFVCDARVLVKPYKEKGKVPDKKQQQADRLDFSSFWTSTGLDSPLDIGGRMFYNIGNGSVGAQDGSLLRRRLEEQQQAELLQQAIELQGRRFQLLDLKTRSFSTAVSATTANAQIASSTAALAKMASSCNGISSPVVSQDDGNDLQMIRWRTNCYLSYFGCLKLEKNSFEKPAEAAALDVAQRCSSSSKFIIMLVIKWNLQKSQARKIIWISQFAKTTTCLIVPSPRLPRPHLSPQISLFLQHQAAEEATILSEHRSCRHPLPSAPASFKCQPDSLPVMELLECEGNGKL